jgi:glyoxylase-like metal-dependent hydrolase (beta-lactamase superfamily II)
MKIASITAPNPGAFTLDGTRTWLLGHSAVIDPGPAIDSHINAIRQAMPNLATIFITHRHEDHTPAAFPLKQATGAKIVAPLEWADVRLRGGESFDVEGETLEVIATPGHTGEHVCFLTSSGGLFTGDTVLGSGTTAIFPPDGNMADYMRSLALLRARNPLVIYPAHGPTRENATALLDEYIAHRLDRERQVLKTVTSGAQTITQMRRRIYPDLDPRLERAAEVQLLAHLNKLVDEGRVARDGDRYNTRPEVNG